MRKGRWVQGSARHSFALAVFAVTVLVSGCGDPRGSGTAATLAAEPDAIVLISVDTLRADHLGCYGHSFVQSPSIDTLAAEGIRFTNHISAAPTTLASHTSLMTGLYPHSHGVARNSFIVPEQTVTLAELLRERGFATAAFLGSAVLQSSLNFPQGFDVVDEDFSGSDGGARPQRRAEEVTDSVLAWLSGAPGGPLFLFVHYFDVHWGYRPPSPYDRMYRDDDRPIRGSLDDIKRIRRRLEEGDPEALADARVLDQLYSGEISYTDFHIGRLIDALRARDGLERTLVIVTADHGETMWEHPDLFSHGLGTFDTTVLTPLIVRLPGGARAGRIVESVVSNTDVAPSILEWLGLEIPADMEGVSFASILRSDSLSPRGPVFAEATHPFRAPFESDPRWLNRNKSQAARTEDFKLIYTPTEERFELFDLRADPDEQAPLAATGAEAERLRQALLSWRAQSAPPLACTQDSEETVKQLRALGYVAAGEPRKCNQARD